MTQSKRSALLKKGERLFNSGLYFEAHEVWEEVWKESSGEKKKVLQGLIQAAAGFHKLKQGQPVGAARLFDRAVRKLEGAPALNGFQKEVLQKIKLVPREGIEPTRP